jgi:hypothetical protein
MMMMIVVAPPICCGFYFMSFDWMVGVDWLYHTISIQRQNLIICSPASDAVSCFFPAIPKNSAAGRQQI